MMNQIHFVLNFLYGSKWVGALGHSPNETEKTAEESWLADRLTAHQRWETPLLILNHTIN